MFILSAFNLISANTNTNPASKQVIAGMEKKYRKFVIEKPNKQTVIGKSNLMASFLMSVLITEICHKRKVNTNKVKIKSKLNPVYIPS